MKENNNLTVYMNDVSELPGHKDYFGNQIIETIVDIK